MLTADLRCSTRDVFPYDLFERALDHTDGLTARSFCTGRRSARHTNAIEGRRDNPEPSPGRFTLCWPVYPGGSLSNQ
ncbi:MULTISPECIES: hypothetical protein [Actinoalloteichus]|uniref:hypothetical protein n=1 Tax=Actinoalloteichus TaxID=65496 RepID=UPI0012DF2E07|nr:hypothetical protein [Actinoalloteichus caeruleus]